ncbi:carbohydrate ABC transporter permease, partial [Streptomyces carpaticus]
MSATRTRIRTRTRPPRPTTRRRRSIPGRIALYSTLTLLLVVFAAPLVWALSGSFKPRGDIFDYPPPRLP